MKNEFRMTPMMVTSAQASFSKTQNIKILKTQQGLGTRNPSLQRGRLLKYFVPEQKNEPDI